MNNDFDGFLDGSFDAALDAMDLPWLPWVGSRYREAEGKTIILGESIYVYGSGDETVLHRILKKDSLRQRQMTHGILAKFKSRYLRNFERAVFLKRRPVAAERALLWSQVIYHNLVPRLLPSRKDRPTYDDYTKGWRVFLELAEVVQAQRCIVYGLESLKVKALLDLLSRDVITERRRLPAVGRNRPLALSFLLNGREMNLLFMRHPSAFFRWSKWGTVLRETGMIPIALT